MSKAVISIIVPVWNGAIHLEETLQSVVGQEISGATVQLVLADDGSSDDSAKLCEKYADIFLPLPHGGTARAMNRAMREAKGEALMFLDQDDLLLPHALDCLWRLLAGRRAVSGMAQDFISPEIPGEEASRIMLRAAPYYGLLTGCMLIRRQLAREVGNFNENYQAGQAVDWLMRLKEKEEPYKTGLVTAARRIHAGNASRLLRQRQWHDYAEILRAKNGGRKHA